MACTFAQKVGYALHLWPKHDIFMSRCLPPAGSLPWYCRASRNSMKIQIWMKFDEIRFPFVEFPPFVPKASAFRHFRPISPLFVPKASTSRQGRPPWRARSVAPPLGPRARRQVRGCSPFDVMRACACVLCVSGTECLSGVSAAVPEGCVCRRGCNRR